MVSDRPWPERAETTETPASLTVLGVDRGDSGLPAELHGVVPADADVLCIDRPDSPPSRDQRLRAYLRNPALLLLGIAGALAIASDYVSYGTTSRAFDREAVENVARERELPIVSVGRSPLVAGANLSKWWHLGGWFVAFCLLAAAASALVFPGGGTLLFFVAALAAASAYVLAYIGVTIERDRDRLFGAIHRTALENEYDHPVAIVRRRHVPGIADQAKEERIRTHDHTVSPVADSDWWE